MPKRLFFNFGNCIRIGSLGGLWWNHSQKYLGAKDTFDVILNDVRNNI